ncbi:hypothetical protein [Bacillus sp. SG-1]|uniref:hypothetical protein n=1 Tax=Bacillus sp. SG-1 TaxID=161544 RepID=UPI0005C752F4|nr:hypothetical protein [Bacillus sp. SG-1]
MNELYFLVVILLGFIITVFYISHGYSRDRTIRKEIRNEVRQEDIVLVLDWMLIYGVINTHEYNILLRKSLPFLK